MMDVEALRLAATNPAAMVVAGADALPQAGKGAPVPLPRVTSETKAGFEGPPWPQPQQKRAPWVGTI